MMECVEMVGKVEERAIAAPQHRSAVPTGLSPEDGSQAKPAAAYRAHTPGPWAVFERPPANEIFGPAAASFVHCGPDVRDDTGFDLIARAYTRDGLNERQANARLIAAAPDLLAALETFVSKYVEMVNSGDAGFWDPETEPKVIAARAALAKAGAA
jgi:hypothetical protein